MVAPHFHEESGICGDSCLLADEIRDKLTHWPTWAGLMPLASPDLLLYPVLEAI